LTAERVLARRYFYPGCHRSEPYRSLYPGIGRALPRTEAAVTRVLALPTGLAVKPADVAAISSLIRFAVEHADEIRARSAAMGHTPTAAG
jgi:dTDP-4-amino-4,6-dideoxygalactose transaminase